MTEFAALGDTTHCLRLPKPHGPSTCGRLGMGSCLRHTPGCLRTCARARRSTTRSTGVRSPPGETCGSRVPERPTDHYLPPGMPGFRDTHVYPLTPDVAKARQLAQGRGKTAVLYTCSQPPCPEEARIVKSDLA